MEYLMAMGVTCDNAEKWTWVRGLCESVKMWGEAGMRNRWLDIFKAVPFSFLDRVFIKNICIKSVLSK